VIESFGRWGVRWAFGDPRPEELDPVLLMWKIHQRINRHLLPPRRVVVEFEFAGQRPRRVWLVLKSDDVSLGLKPPGFDADLLITADLGAFYCVWLGRTSFDKALREGNVLVEGPPTLTRAFPRWLQWSPMAEHVRDAAPSSA
jgi:hypothetical protein